MGEAPHGDQLTDSQGSVVSRRSSGNLAQQVSGPLRLGCAVGLYLPPVGGASSGAWGLPDFQAIYDGFNEVHVVAGRVG